MSDQAMSRISKVSKIVRIWLVLAIFFQVAIYAALLFFTEQNATNFHISIDGGFDVAGPFATPSGNESDLGKALIEQDFNALALLGWVDVLIYCLLYFFLYRLFSLYQQGQIFTQSNIHQFKCLGYTMLAWVLIDLIYPNLLVLVLRLSGLAPEPLPLELSVNSTDLKQLMIGLMIYVIGWVMTEAKTLQQEQELTI